MSHRSNSRPEVFCKENVIISFAEFTGKHLCRSVIFNKVTGLSEVCRSKRLILSLSKYSNINQTMATD